MTTETATVASSGPVIPGVGTVAGPLEDDTTIGNATTGLMRTSNHEYTMNGVGPYYSVTTFLDIIHKEPLYQWAKRIVAEIAVEKYDQLGQTIRQQGPQAAIDWLKSLPGYQRDTAARIGTAVHHLADLLGRDRKPLETFGISEQALPLAQAAAAFLDAYGRSRIVSSEKAVISFSEGYAGTYDLLMLLPTGPGNENQLWLLDWKTSRGGTYPETGLQLAAYGHAEHIVLPNDPTLYPMPHIDRYGVVHLRTDMGYPDGYCLYEYDVRESDFRAFLAARDLWAWRKEGRFRNTPVIPPPV